LTSLKSSRKTLVKFLYLTCVLLRIFQNNSQDGFFVWFTRQDKKTSAVILFDNPHRQA